MKDDQERGEGKEKKSNDEAPLVAAVYFRKVFDPGSPNSSSKRRVTFQEQERVPVG